MKKIYILSMLFLFGLTLNAQKITKEQFSNLSEANKELFLSITKSDSLRDIRINEFLSNNPLVLRTYVNESGVLFGIRDIMNNKPIYFSTHNSDAAAATKTNQLQNGGSMGLDLDGTGMVVGVWDAGPAQDTHVEFQNAAGTDSRIILMDNDLVSGEIGFHFHGTHVTGTISAKGASPNAKGMATNVTIKSYNWNSDSSEMITAANDATNPILLSNHSYGIPVDNVDPWFMGAYSSGSREVDAIAQNNPKYLIVTSAGNDGSTTYNGGLANGFDKLTSTTTSKNNLVVANASPMQVPFSDDYTFVINQGSSQGPTDDLRIKPDISGDGTQLFGPSVNDSYITISGTSMSAPNVTGSLVLLQEYYNELNGEFMNSSTLKGLVCHTAVDDEDSIGPDPEFGWGLLDSKASAEIILASTNGTAVLDELTLDNGDTYSMTFNAVAGEKLSATICWTDIRGTAVSGDLNNMTPVLVNDLDIRLSKDGTTYFPWKLNLGGGVSGFSTTKADNIVDNVERVDIETPETGTYTLTVSHKGTLQSAVPLSPLAQDFALILSGQDITLSTEEVNYLDTVRVWPNPANEILNISMNSLNAKTKISLFDIHGREVYKQNLDGNTSIVRHSIDIKEFSSGVYFLNINNGNLTYNKKIIVN